MTQDERWIELYNEVIAFIMENHRNPSHHFYEERNMHSWVRHNRKMMKAGEMKEDRRDLFKGFIDLCERYRRKNQWK